MGSTALSTSNVYATTVETIDDVMAEDRSDWERFTEIHTGDEAAKRLNASATVLDPQTWDEASDIGSAESLGVAHTVNVTPQGYSHRIDLTRGETTTQNGEDNVSRKVTQAIRRFREWLNRQAFLAVAGMFTSTVDDGNGGMTAAISAGHYCVDGSTQRSNLLTDVFSQAALEVALQRLASWRDYMAKPLHPSPQGYSLIVSPMNANLARALLQSPQMSAVMEQFTGSTELTHGLTNPHSRYGINVIEYPLELIGGDDDDWFLAPPGGATGDREGNQFHLWLRRAPDVVVQGPEVLASKGFRILIDFSLKYFVSAPTGKPWLGSNIA